MKRKIDAETMAAIQKEAQEQIKKCFEDNEATLPSGNKYTFTKLTHKKRLKVFTRLQLLEEQELMFFDTPDFEIVEKIVEDSVLFDGMQLSKLPKHWEQYPQDFFMFYKTAMGVISYPFFARRELKLTFRIRDDGESYIRQCNVSETDMTIFFLAKKGYGSIEHIETWDTPQFLDVVEYERIMSNIEAHLIDKAKET